jgi:hypothetical protein
LFNPPRRKAGGANKNPVVLVLPGFFMGGSKEVLFGKYTGILPTFSLSTSSLHANFLTEKATNPSSL